MVNGGFAGSLMRTSSQYLSTQGKEFHSVLLTSQEADA